MDPWRDCERLYDLLVTQPVNPSGTAMEQFYFVGGDGAIAQLVSGQAPRIEEALEKELRSSADMFRKLWEKTSPLVEKVIGLSDELGSIEKIQKLSGRCSFA